MKPQGYVEAVLRVWRKYLDLVALAFQNDAGFVAALDKVRINCPCDVDGN